MTPRDLMLVETDARDGLGDDGPPSMEDCRDLFASTVAGIKCTIWMQAQDNQTKALRRQVDRLTDMVIEQREWIQQMQKAGVKI